MPWNLLGCRQRHRKLLDGYLADDWEPFAVSGPSDDETVWLRRRSDRVAAGVIDPPPQTLFERELRERMEDNYGRRD